MSAPSGRLSRAAKDFTTLLNRFVDETAGLIDAMVVSSDGLLITMARNGERDRSDRIAAITCAIHSLAGGASKAYELGHANKVIIDLDHGFMLVSAITPGCILVVLTRRTADIGDVAYEMTMFAGRAESVLSPQLIEELRSTAGPETT